MLVDFVIKRLRIMLVWYLHLIADPPPASTAITLGVWLIAASVDILIIPVLEAIAVSMAVVVIERCRVVVILDIARHIDFLKRHRKVIC